jgi:hypothetical protein
VEHVSILDWIKVQHYELLEPYSRKCLYCMKIDSRTGMELLYFEDPFMIVA